ncbi:hypothetical protein BLD25_00320 [Candidatus Gracilibacteria bacterium GN02-872]|nr:hypothetical protein BLD25_00320 [Candidatus Gracilibacteria bacterium GN02-872]RKW22102.1 MAG: MGMT family protein [Candidatus Gracilibacteria bacterium]
MEEIKKQILEYLQSIPKGKVTTYKNIALKFGVHPRKVAMIMKHNKDPIKYPCYKVVAYDGKISGYSTEKGVSEKIFKLKNDGVKIIEGKVLKEFII